MWGVIYKAILVCVCLFFLSISNGQTIDEIKNGHGIYLFGEGKASTIKKADKDALEELVSQISVSVNSRFDLLRSETGDNYTETFNSVISTYSNVTGINAKRIIVEDEPNAVVVRYMCCEDIEELFAQRKAKILEYALQAQSARKKLQIGDALCYYYWAFALLRSHPDGSSITCKDETGQERNAAIYIPAQINDIFNLINITITEVQTEGNHQNVLLNITYDGKTVRNFSYTYFDGNDWSNIISAKDGRGIAEIPLNSDPEKLRLKGEYVFESIAKNDKELGDVLGSMEDKAFSASRLTISANGNIFQQPQEQVQSAPKQVESANVFHAVADTVKYLTTLKQVESAIRSHNYAAAKEAFTEEGYAIYQKLIAYGNASIVGTPEYHFAEDNSGVMCRALPLCFKFSNNRVFIEDIVFDFTTDGHISSLSFALSKAAIKDIASKQRWGEHSRLTLIRFLEDYQTAYALKRLDYLENVFAETAKIIVGHVLKANPVQENSIMMDKQIAVRTQLTKREYLDRLKISFAGKEYINLRLTNCDIRKTREEIYGIQIKQDYYSDNYGDTGYLFLLVDLRIPEKPIIHVRTWQEEKDPEFGVVELEHFRF